MVVVKTEVENIVRDTDSGALLANDPAGLSAYKKSKQRQSEINNIVNKVKEIDDMKNDISEIKRLLSKLVEKM